MMVQQNTWTHRPVNDKRSPHVEHVVTDVAVIIVVVGSRYHVGLVQDALVQKGVA